MAIVNADLGTGDTDVFTAGAGESAITVIYLCNTSAGAITVQVHAVPNGDTVDDSNKIYHDLEIPAGDTYVIDAERLILENGDKITASASVASEVAATISYKAI